MQFDIGQISLVGDRKINQDRAAVFESEYGLVMVLGDGLGGRPGGELAAHALIETVTKRLRQTPLPVPDPFEFLEGVLQQAHHEIMAVGREQTPPIEPGTTGVMCLVQDGCVWWAHIGDSRFYLFRHGLSLYRSQDHSYVEKLYQNGEISLSKRDTHPMRNYVTRCLGMVAHEPEVELSKETQLQEGDILLLCSDGFWQPLDDAQIGARINNQDRLSDSLETLARQAERLSSPIADNTTVIAVRVISLQQPDKNGLFSNRKTNKSNTSLVNEVRGEIEKVMATYGHEMEDKK